MRYLVTGEQMKAIDGYTIHTVGIPSLVLMERAAMAVAREAEARIKAGQHVWAVCGTGNNGADGVAAARMLALKGHSVTVIVAGDPNRGTKEFHVQKEIAERLKISMVEWKDFLPGRCDLLIDALFGVGLTREIEGEYREIIEAVNGMNPQTVIAVDMPSGIHSTTGQVMGDAVKAHVTVTFGYGKLGTALYPGREYCGELVVEDIGFPDVSAKEAGPFAWTYGREDLHRMPARPACSNKGTFGKVLLIAGCSGMSGAAYLAGLAAYRAGAGLVKIMTVDQNRTILQQLLPEAVVTVYSPQEILPDGQEPETEKEPGERLCCSSAWEKRIEKECAWADVIVMGPGRLRSHCGGCGRPQCHRVMASAGAVLYGEYYCHPPSGRDGQTDRRDRGADTVKHRGHGPGVRQQPGDRVRAEGRGHGGDQPGRTVLYQHQRKQLYGQGRFRGCTGGNHRGAFVPGDGTI